MDFDKFLETKKYSDSIDAFGGNDTGYIYLNGYYILKYRRATSTGEPPIIEYSLMLENQEYTDSDITCLELRLYVYLVNSGYVTPHKYAERALCDILQAYTKEKGLMHLSADDLLYAYEDMLEIAEFLKAYIKVWDYVVENNL